MNATPRRVRLFVTGRVQGVGFRYATEDAALRLGVHGWVRNRPDGSVEILAEADRRVLDEFIAWCHEGPRMARVQSVQTTEEAADDALDSFRIRG